MADGLPWLVNVYDEILRADAPAHSYKQGADNPCKFLFHVVDAVDL